MRERRETAGFDNWTCKGGVMHIEPPAALLQDMVALRLHLDDCPAENGALEVLAGSFRLGRLTVAQVLSEAKRQVSKICAARRGELVAMRGLTIHASQAAAIPAHRRVVHVDFADRQLPPGLHWHGLAA